ncbi:MAG: hypothetical protein KZQ66_18065 [Candidatus Thiodiazotropha sp. (ex Lucinoma aequizonata)]|nr:hypothetical protein [Candidatus Thiodiazotropha sp. (ex Lucinoma aequizonata)]MCU7888180.1 hypothetical protein [Candidatus Thiodiazotropha sp. (ex Lucinoma aequizonata)]MCU7894519.1 hypothetical protein [Candidatus Thiodiazotropha sp. (ex Lucinoma aequizonata)]MCU7897452.1 hypothetical protein [Candidatus Thiodiazotropha sp. (ex Lucinoma aequizonata)]MCU7903653.1 hypothetical protein [Candidatus Thiodiazotropha sp. (ex Lucinoma aequizonata)]
MKDFGTSQSTKIFHEIEDTFALSLAIPAIQPRLRLSGINRLRSAFHGAQRGNVVNLIGRGGQYFAEKVPGWNRVTIRKGQTELRSGTTFESCFSARGRRRIEQYLPNLLDNETIVVNRSNLPQHPYLFTTQRR